MNRFEAPPGRPEMVAVRCPKCGGQKVVKDQSGQPKPCPTCDGTGQVRTR